MMRKKIAAREVAKAVLALSAALMLAIPLAGCLVVGGSSRGGFFLWPSGGVLLLVLVLFLLLRRR